jgi:hypothetical protein
MSAWNRSKNCVGRGEYRRCLQAVGTAPGFKLTRSGSTDTGVLFPLIAFNRSKNCVGRREYRYYTFYYSSIVFLRTKYHVSGSSRRKPVKTRAFNLCSAFPVMLEYPALDLTQNSFNH